jgi:hypothetical protein
MQRRKKENPGEPGPSNQICNVTPKQFGVLETQI